MFAWRRWRRCSMSARGEWAQLFELGSGLGAVAVDVRLGGGAEVFEVGLGGGKWRWSRSVLVATSAQPTGEVFHEDGGLLFAEGGDECVVEPVPVGVGDRHGPVSFDVVEGILRRIRATAPLHRGATKEWNRARTVPLDGPVLTGVARNGRGSFRRWRDSRYQATVVSRPSRSSDGLTPPNSSSSSRSCRPGCGLDVAGKAVLALCSKRARLTMSSSTKPPDHLQQVGAGLNAS